MKRDNKKLIIIALTIIFIISGIFLLKRYLYHSAYGKYLACQSHGKKIVLALDNYYRANGKYPDSLQELIPKHQNNLKGGMHSGRDTYSETYITSKDGEAFTFYCKGSHHRWITRQDNYPQFNSKDGIIARP